jgi:hypothetical protein
VESYLVMRTLGPQAKLTLLKGMVSDATGTKRAGLLGSMKNYQEGSEGGRNCRPDEGEPKAGGH